MNLTRVVRTLLSTALVGSAARLVAQAPPAFTAEPVTIQRAPGQLTGTLLAPRTNARVPVLLLIAGSGPTDRDGNGPGSTPGSLRQLAESLAVHQVATLRFDKRGVGGSASATIPEVQLTFELLAEDAAAWARVLTRDARFSQVIVAGHSEGALLGLLAIQQVHVAGYVSIAGLARPADEVLHDQLAKQLPAPLLAQSDSILTRLKRGATTDSTPPMLASLFRPSVQPYLMSWFKYSGRAELARLSIPCLVVQGTHDLQVSSTEADLLQQANPRCEVARIAGMNHVLKQAPADLAGQLPSYRAPDALLAPALVDAILAFVRVVGK